MCERALRFVPVALWLQLLAGGVAAADPAAAKPASQPVRQSVAVLELSTEDVEPELVPVLTQALRDELDKKGLTVETPEVVEKKLEAAGIQSGCLVGPCLSAYVVPLGTHTGLIVALKQTGNSYRVVATVLALDSGAPIAQITDHCDVCEIKEGIDMMDRAADAFAAKAADTEAPPVAAPVEQQVLNLEPSPIYRMPVRLVLVGAGVLAVCFGGWLLAHPHGALGGGAAIGVGGLFLGSGAMLWLTAPGPTNE